MLISDEVPIPFDAFIRDVDTVEDVDVIADEIDGTIAAAQPPSLGSAVAVGRPVRTRPGRVVVALSMATSDRQDVDELVDRLVDRLAEVTGLALDGPDGHVHHDPADLEHRAQVDVARGRLATALDIVVCTHEGGPGTYVVTVEGPADRLGALVSATGAAPTASRKALLTATGPMTTEAEGSSVLVAATEHAHRIGGRATVFPGQEWLADDVPVVDVLRRTPIDEVRSTQGTFAPTALLRAYGFVRPRYEDGALVLSVGHDDPLVVTPWEVRYCRPCCGADH
jgi:hypothetical protein